MKVSPRKNKPHIFYCPVWKFWRIIDAPLPALFGLDRIDTWNWEAHVFTSTLNHKLRKENKISF